MFDIYCSLVVISCLINSVEQINCIYVVFFIVLVLNYLLFDVVVVVAIQFSTLFLIIERNSNIWYGVFEKKTFPSYEFNKNDDYVTWCWFFTNKLYT